VKNTIGVNKNVNVLFTYRKSAISGVISGAIAQYAASPADLIKVQIQMEGKRRLMGEPPR